MDRTIYILEEVRIEREKQDRKWGEQNHDLPVWLTVLSEEVGEVAEAILEYRAVSNKPKDIRQELRIAIRDELLQVAAVAVAAIEYLDRSREEE